MKKIAYFLIILISVVQLTSCEVDFSPNAEWKEVPVVYCILNQDEDTTFARVQKCYLGENNLNEYVAIPDSINYPKDALTVKLLEWQGRESDHRLLEKIGENPLREFDLEYTLKPKNEGIFDAPYQPVYACETKNKLDTNCVYQLVVIKNATGDTIAQSETTLLGGNCELYRVNGNRPRPNNKMFLFEFGKYDCPISWITWSRSRLYQTIIRFYYKQDGIVKSVDIKCPEVVNSGKSLLEIRLSKGAYFSDLKKALEGDTSPKDFVHHVDIIIDACGEDLNAYLSSIRAINAGSQNTEVYTNIDNGVGVFSSRRTVTTYVPSDSTASPGKYMSFLKELNVGF